MDWKDSGRLFCMSSLLHKWWFVLALGGMLYLHDFLFMMVLTVVGFPGGLVVKNPPARTQDSRDVGSIPELGRSPEVGKWQAAPVFLPRKFQRREMDRGAWRSTVYGVTNSQIWLSDWAHTHLTVDWQSLSVNSLNVDIYMFSSVQSISHVWLFAIPWTTACQASLSISNFQSPPKPTSIESVMPSNHLILCCPLLLLLSIFPSIRVFSNVNSLHQVAKVLEFQIQHQSFQWTPRTDLL